jgi:hypothetical protein
MRLCFKLWVVRFLHFFIFVVGVSAMLTQHESSCVWILTIHIKQRNYLEIVFWYKHYIWYNHLTNLLIHLKNIIHFRI